MTISQLFLSVVVLWILIQTLARTFRERLPFFFNFAWFCFWILTLLVINNTELTSKVANSIGIGRGADLIIYLSIIGLFFMLYRLYLQQLAADRAITRLIRRMAIDSAKKFKKH